MTNASTTKPNRPCQVSSPRRRIVDLPPKPSPAVPHANSRLLDVLRALRPYQWSKNLLLFVPLLCTNSFGEPRLLTTVVLASIAFSLSASAGYVLNDLLDRRSDAHCSRRRQRPFASGALQIRDGAWMICILATSSCLLAVAWLPEQFLLVLAIYLTATAAYSAFFKHYSMLDIVSLSGFYLLRICAGGIAVGILPSHWLLCFSAFFFANLALLKRYANLVCDLRERKPRDKTVVGAAVARPYGPRDLPLLSVLGAASGCAAFAVFSCYVCDEVTHAVYQRPFLLWLAASFLVYWTIRAWSVARRGRMGQDPIWFAVRDPASVVCGFSLVLLFILAT
jgi:4-hydroxybenzoate polyprenyltransferase